jgi:hypothetical protein
MNEQTGSKTDVPEKWGYHHKETLNQKPASLISPQMIAGFEDTMVTPARDVNNEL